jgi:hypothetical protein
MAEFLEEEQPLIWITLINYGYIHFTKNFLKSIKKYGVNMKLYVYCINFDKCYNELKEFDNCVCLNAELFIKKKISENLTSWSQKEYKEVVFCKLNAIKYTLMNTHSKGVKAVGYIDTDIIVLSNPTDVIMKYMIEFPDISIFTQCDEVLKCSNINNCKNICSGVIVFKNNPAYYNIFDYNDKDIYKFMGDQDFLLGKIRASGIKTITIDKNIFINGTYPGIRPGSGNFILQKEASLIHFNYLIGNEKEKQMRRLGMWFL